MAKCTKHGHLIPGFSCSRCRATEELIDDVGCGELIDTEVPEEDNVAHPSHYTSHPSGIECIQITEHMGFNLGNALKYIWRCDLKHDAIEDLEKAKWYIDRELDKRRK